MSKCSAKELCEVYRGVESGDKTGLSSDELWALVAEGSGLTFSTARQKIGSIRKNMAATFLSGNDSVKDFIQEIRESVSPKEFLNTLYTKASKSEDEDVKAAFAEAKSDASEILPFFPRTGGGGRTSTDISDCVADLVAEYESKVDAADAELETETADEVSELVEA